MNVWKMLTGILAGTSNKTATKELIPKTNQLLTPPKVKENNRIYAIPNLNYLSLQEESQCSLNDLNLNNQGRNSRTSQTDEQSLSVEMSENTIIQLAEYTNHKGELDINSLMRAIENGKEDIAIEILKNKDIDINFQDDQGATALMWAINKGQENVALEILKHKDIDINLQNKNKETELIYAIVKS